MKAEERVALLLNQGCNCAAVDIGVDIQHEPMCGWPSREEIEGEFRAHANEALESAMAALCPGCRHAVETWEQKEWLPDGLFRQFRGWLHKYGNGQILPCDAGPLRTLKE